MSLPPIQRQPAATLVSALPQRLPYLDSLRGIAALIVAFHHVLFTCWDFPEVAIPPNFSPWLSWLKYGHFSVTFFIVLSGFVIMLPLAKGVGNSSINGDPNWGLFFKRRARRILPAYFAALALSLTLLVWFHGWKAINPADLLGHLLLLHDWGLGDRFAINGPMWSIPVEWHIYFTVPALYLLWRRLGVTAAALAWLVGGYVLYWCLPEALRGSAALHYYGIFAVGGATAYYVVKANQGGRTWGVPHATILIVASGIWALLTWGFGWKWLLAHDRWSDLPFAVLSSMVLFYLTLNESRLRRFLSMPVLILLGEMSYSLYLVHGPLLDYFNGKFIDMFQPTAGAKFFLLSFVAIPVIIAAAYLFHRVFERPFFSRRAPGRLPVEGAVVEN